MGDFPGAWLNWRLSLANVCPELNFLFQTSAIEKDGVWTMGQSFGFFLLPPFHPVTIIEKKRVTAFTLPFPFLLFPIPFSFIPFHLHVLTIFSRPS